MVTVKKTGQLCEQWYINSNHTIVNAENRKLLTCFHGEVCLSSIEKENFEQKFIVSPFIE